MKISQVSFCGNNNYSSYDNNRANPERIREDLRKSTGFDTYVSSAQSVPKANKGKKKTSHNPYKTACLLIALLKLLSMAGNVVSDPKDVTEAKAKAGENVEEYAVVYNIPAEVIMDYNNLSDYTFGSDRTIQIPSMYDHVGAEIEEMQEDLYKRGTDVDEAAELADKIEDLQEIQQLQSEIATMYTDGDYVYFLITLPTDETATETQKGYNGSINVEDFKDIFGIKDGVIKKYNDLSFSWGSDEHGGYMDFTGNRFMNGETVKVPKSAVKLSLIEGLDD